MTAPSALTREEIARIIEEAHCDYKPTRADYLATADTILSRLPAQAVGEGVNTAIAAEREACAKIADERAIALGFDVSECWRIARDIRSRATLPSPPAEPSGEMVEAHERLRVAYQELEAMCASYRATAKIDLSTVDDESRELALWAAAEAERWLDPRAGSGAADSFGQRLRKIAGVLVLRASGAGQIKAENNNLRAALKPFSEIALARDWDKQAEDMIEGPDLTITPDQVRKARAALSSAGKKP